MIFSFMRSIALLCGFLCLLPAVAGAQQQTKKNARDRNGRTPIMNAAMFGRVNEVQSLLAQGVDINMTDTDGMTALMWAALSGRLEVVKLLMEAGADTKIKDGKGHTASYYAEVIGNRAMVQMINSSPHQAVQPHPPVAQSPVSAPLPVRAAPADSVSADAVGTAAPGYQPITPRAVSGIVDAATSLPPPLLPASTLALGPALAATTVATLPVDIFGSILTGIFGSSRGGARTSSRATSGGNGQGRESTILDIGSSHTSALMTAVILNHAKEVPDLLAKGADVNAKDAEGRTALMWAAMGGNTDIVKALLEAGADAGLIDNKGYSAETYAELAGNKALVPLIRSARNANR